MRLMVAGSVASSTGRLEIFYAGEWGTVCDDAFDHVAATVACKSLNSRFVYNFSFCMLKLQLALIGRPETGHKRVYIKPADTAAPASLSRPRTFLLNI